MPFRSEKQRAWMWANRPDIAKRWSDKYGSKPIPNKRLKARTKKRETKKV